MLVYPIIPILSLFYWCKKRPPFHPSLPEPLRGVPSWTRWDFLPMPGNCTFFIGENMCKTWIRKCEIHSPELCCDNESWEPTPLNPKHAHTGIRKASHLDIATDAYHIASFFSGVKWCTAGSASNINGSVSISFDYHTWQRNRIRHSFPTERQRVYKMYIYI